MVKFCDKSSWGKKSSILLSKDKMDRLLARLVQEKGIYYFDRQQALTVFHTQVKNVVNKRNNPYHFENAYVGRNDLDRIGKYLTSGAQFEEISKEIFCQGETVIEESVFRARMVKCRAKHPDYF